VAREKVNLSLLQMKVRAARGAEADGSAAGERSVGERSPVGERSVGQHPALAEHSDGPASTVDRAADLTSDVKKVAKKKRGIIVLPEYQFEPFFVSEVDIANFEYASSSSSERHLELSSIAREHECVIVAPFFEKVMEGVFYSSAAVIDADGTMLGVYRKNHIQLSGGYQEKFYYKPGNSGYQVFKTRYGNIGVLLSYDLAFPESSRILALGGADLIVVPAALDSECASLMRTFACAQAASNNVYLALLLATGECGNMKFSGHSVVFGPGGEKIAEAEKKASTLHVELDMAKLAEAKTAHPFFRDRRPEQYRMIVEQLP
jgi:predicted amidohydrolase